MSRQANLKVATKEQLLEELSKRLTKMDRDIESLRREIHEVKNDE